MRGSWKRGAVSALMATAVLAGCRPQETKQDAGPPPDTAVPVQVATLQTRPFTVDMHLFGKVDADERVRLAAEVPGRLDAFPFNDGDPISRGQVVARINARLAQAQLDQAKAAQRLAQSQLDRTQKLHAKEMASAAELDAIRAQAEQAAAAVEVAEVSLARSVVRAPVSGIANNVTAHEGEYTNPGVPLLEIVDISHVKIVAQVPERDIGLLREGTAVQMQLDALPGRSFTGKVTRVGLTADSATRTFPVEVRIANPDRALRPGMMVHVIVEKQHFAQALLVPRDAVLEELEGRSVFVVENGVAKRRKVELGETRAALAMVRTGVAAGEQLVTLGHSQVVDGQQVKVVRASVCCGPSEGGAGNERGQAVAPAAQEQ